MAPAKLPDPHAVTTDAELEAAIGAPGERVKIKLRTEIDDTARAFIERSPFVVVATCDADGRLDASPKGELVSVIAADLEQNYRDGLY
jgi:predicted pyridoxine 5'-phosphate oxidase superfamily flavin-nucleotide-binding protein